MPWSVRNFISFLNRPGRLHCQRAFTLIDPVSWRGVRPATSGTDKLNKAFTLIELLITITILAILGSAISLVLNPAELLAEARDSQRINDLESLRNSLSLTLIDNPSLFQSLSSTNIYLSLPTCTGLTPPTGYTYICSTTPTNINGSGWLPLSLTNLPNLPIDPINSSSDSIYYAFVPDLTNKTFVLTSLLESEKYLKLSALKDGGTDPGRIEEGNPSLWTSASGLMGYWPMDGTIGANIANNQITNLSDYSGRNNNGAASNANGTGMSFVQGKSGTAVRFDGTDDSINIANAGGSMDFGTGSFSYGLWYYSYASTGLYDMPWYKGGSSATNPGYDMELGTSSWVGLVVDGVVTRGVGLGSEVLNQWKLLFVVVDRTDGYVYGYVDGSLVSSTALSGLGSTSNGTGAVMSNLSYKVNGIIDEARVYGRALSAGEIKAIFTSQN